MLQYSLLITHFCYLIIHVGSIKELRSKSNHNTVINDKIKKRLQCFRAYLL